jgi:hypothetical protein
MRSSRRAFFRRLGLLLAVLPAWAVRELHSEPVIAASTLDVATRALLLRLCQRLLPLDGIPESSFRAVVDALDVQAARQAATRTLLLEGCAAAQARIDAAPAGAAERDLDEYLAARTATPFLALLRGTAVPLLLNDHAVWARAGYEGESLTQGGYLYRGFADLDWLPAPPADVMGKVE